MTENVLPGPTPTPITFDPGVRSKFQIMQGRTYAHSYPVCKFQGSSANSVGGESGQDGGTDERTDIRMDGRMAEITTISPRFSKSVGIIMLCLDLNILVIKHVLLIVLISPIWHINIYINMNIYYDHNGMLYEV